MEVLEPLDLILHAGDVLYHGVFNPITETYDPRQLAEILNEIETPMIHARGNCDSEVDQLALNNHILSDFAFASVDGTRILVCHGHKWTEGMLVEMASRGGIHIVHRGHTHVPELHLIEGVLLINAGSCALPKQEGEAPTAGLLHNGTIKIFDLDSGEVYSQGELTA